MRKLFVLAGLVAALAVPTAAMAASLHEAHIGSSCPAGDIGTYHFVNNQTGGTGAAGTLTVQFSSGNQGPIAPYMVLKSVNHYSVTATGTLLGASTTLPGNLVLSDLSCKKKA